MRYRGHSVCSRPHSTVSTVAALPVILFCLPVLLVAQVYEGLTLYTPMGGRTTYLINNSGQTIRSWSSSYSCAYMTYWMPDSSIWRNDVYSGAVLRGAAYGGRMQQYDWNGNIIRSFIWSNANHQQHHDFHVMPNGNVLLISWDRKTQAEAQAMGRLNISGDIWPDEVIEYDPVTNQVVWEWHFWDHLIQDVDPSKPNYGVISEHPERLNINLGSVQSGDWIHCNTIDYNAERDEIVLTSHNLNEIYVIDHSTTTEEARGSTGGRRGRGGDFLYRWGNPQNYGRGTSADRVFYVVHGANWIRPGMPGEGDIIVLNNGDRPGTSNDYSVICQITPPLDSLGNYYIHPESAFGPRTMTWSYGPGSSFYSQHLGGAYRLENGNTFAILGTSGTLKEITPDGQVVWTRTVGGQLGRAFKYPMTPVTAVREGQGQPGCFRFEHSGPNPFSTFTEISYSLPVPGNVRLTICDVAGRVLSVLDRGMKEAGSYRLRFVPDADLPAGIYVARLEVTDASYTATVTLVKER